MKIDLDLINFYCIFLYFYCFILALFFLNFFAFFNFLIGVHFINGYFVV